MPVITLEIAPLSPSARTTLIAGLTREAAKVTGIPEASFVVLIREMPMDAIGVGGVQFSTIKGSGAPRS